MEGATWVHSMANDEVKLYVDYGIFIYQYIYSSKVEQNALGGAGNCCLTVRWYQGLTVYQQHVSIASSSSDPASKYVIAQKPGS